MNRARTKRAILICGLLAVVGTISGVGVRVNAATPVAVNVRDYGARGNGWTNDTAAIQKANDAVYSRGGGRVYFPAGTYVAAGVMQDSGVEFAGDLKATLKHPNGTNPFFMVRSRVLATTGSIIGGARDLRVASATGIRPGALIAVAGEGDVVPGQTVNAPYRYTQVVSVAGNVVSLKDPMPITVDDAVVRVGAVNIAIRGLNFDGNSPYGGSRSANMVAIEYFLARYAVVAGNAIRNGEHGAISLDLGTSDSIIENNTLTSNGAPNYRMGSAIWMFRGASRNIVRNNTITGQNYWGITMDDRTETATEWDGPSDGNIVENNRLDFPAVDWNAGILIEGCNGNVVRNNTLRNVRTGIFVLPSTQGNTPREADHNVFSGNSMGSHVYGISVNGDFNNFESNLIESTVVPTADRGTGNTFTK